MERESTFSDGDEAVRTIGFEISADGGSYVVPRCGFDSEPSGRTALLLLGMRQSHGSMIGATVGWDRIGSLGLFEQSS